METFLRDLRYAARGLVRTTGFTAIAVVTLAIGIGATTAIFSVVYAVVLQPFPFPEPDRVVAIGERFNGDNLSAVSAGNFNDWRAQSSSFADLGVRKFVSFNVASGDTPERLLGGAVSHTYFSVYRIPPFLGRPFTADDDQPGRQRVVILSHRLWKRKFAEDRSVVGRMIQMDGWAYTIIGVMPEAFDRLDEPEELWVPAAFTREELANHDGHSMSGVARLAPGVSIEQAAAELKVIFNRVKTQVPADTQVRQAVLAPYARQAVGDSRRRLLVLFGAVALVLLIACGNVAHLLLARGRLRMHDIAVRVSLGASGRHLVQQFLAESLVLAVTGAVLGVGLAFVAVPTLVAMGPDNVSRLDQATVNGGVLLFAVAAAVVSALVTGMLPAMSALRDDLRGSMSKDGRTVARGHDLLRGSLIAAEVALAIVLLAGAGLLVRSAIYLQSVPSGFDDRGVLTARVSLPEFGYEDPARVEQAFTSLVERLSKQSTIEAAAVGSSVPMTVGVNHNGLVPEGKTFDPNDFVLGRLGIVSSDYFRAFRIPVVAGRTFTADDRRNSPRVMILSRTAARRLFPGENAIGKRVGCCEAGSDGGTVLKLVVGIVGDVRAEGPQAPASADFYLPIAQAPPDAWQWLQRTLSVVVRGANDDGAAFANAIRGAVREIEPVAPVHNLATMQQRMQTTLARDRFNMMLMLLLSAIGLLLATIGIYGVISCSVVQRRREIAIRVALGAPGRAVLFMMLNQGMRPVWAGVAIGLLGAVAASRALDSYVYGVSTDDPVTFASAIAVLIVSAVLANSLPARRAARVDPASLLAN
jgi:predicted permease